MKITRHLTKNRPRLHGSRPGNHSFSLMNEQGSVLVGLIVTMSILAVAGAAMLSLTATSTYTEIAANRHNAAYYIAESGGNYAIPQIINNAAQAISTLHNRTYTLATGQYFTLALDNSSSTSFIFLTSTGVVSGNSWAEARETITWRFPRTTKSLFDKAVFGNKHIKILQNSYVDSFGTTWTCENCSPDPTISLLGVNGDKKNDIDVNGTVYGSAGELDMGKDMTPKTPPTTFNTLTVNGSTVAQDATLVLNNTTATISSGTYKTKGIQMNNATMTITGDVVFYVTTDADFQENSTVTLNPGATLTVYFDNDLNMKDGARINMGGAAENFVAYGTAAAKKVDIRGDATMFGVIYAPEATIHVKGKDNGGMGPSSVFGSIIGDKVHIYGDSNVHYDRRLLTSAKFSSIVSVGQPTQYFTQ